MLMTMLIMILMMSMMFMTTKHPLSMGLTLIVQTSIIAMMTGTMINMFWFSYILVMTIISGMLILFIYMASMASNEKFKSSMKMTYYAISFFSLSIILPFFMDHTKMMKSWPMKKASIMDAEYSMTLSKLFNLESKLITILMVSYLLLCMIVVSYIVNVHEGSLRSKN